MTFLEHALEYAEAGFAVIPLVPGAKNPICEHGSADGTTNIEQIKKWWALWPDANIGLCVGKVSGIFALDIDFKDGCDPAIKDRLPPTVYAITPNKGLHAFFKYPLQGIKNAKKLEKGCTVRSDGYYFVVPPSVFGVVGNYSWVGRSIIDGEILDSPEWMIAHPGEPKKKNPEEIGIGDRHNTLLARATYYRKSGKDRDWTLKKLVSINEKFPDGPKPNSEILKAVDWAWNNLKTDAQQREENTSSDYLICLGHSGNDYFYTSSSNQQIQSISKSGHSWQSLADLMPKSYWQEHYPKRDTEGLIAGVNWQWASMDLMERCRKNGMFQPMNIRGAGVWLDNDRIVVNMGDHLIIDGTKKEQLGKIDSRYFYTLGKSLQSINPSPLNVDECSIMLKACQKFRWSSEDRGILLAGALVISRVCGALPIRPHVWITGGASTGKTTLLERLVRVIMGESKLYVQGNTTEAGVRQSLKADAIPVLFDEFETSGRKNDENIASLIELMRASWSDSGAVIVKGSSSGNATAFQVRFSAIVSSIRTKLINDADLGRFAVLELAPHGSDSIHWSELSELLAQIDAEYSDRLFARTIHLLPVLIANYRIIKKAFALKVDARFGDQYGMLLAGYSTLIRDREITREEADELTDTIKLVSERENATARDHDDALNHLLTTRFSFDAGIHKKDMLIGQMISTAIDDKESLEKKALIQLGIKVSSEFVYISNSHAELENRVFKNTRWSQNWSGPLGRLPGAVRNEQAWFDDKNRKCIRLGVDGFQDDPAES